MGEAFQRPARSLLPYLRHDTENLVDLRPVVKEVKTEMRALQRPRLWA